MRRSFFIFILPLGATMADEESRQKTHKPFGPEEDIFLARQVNADLPYRAGYGDVMVAWALLLLL